MLLRTDVVSTSHKEEIMDEFTKSNPDREDLDEEHTEDRVPGIGDSDEIGGDQDSGPSGTAEQVDMDDQRDQAEG
jgi:hypothetical protein